MRGLIGKLRGMTLVELLVVVVIVAILALIGMVNYRLGIERALKSADASNLHVIGTALQTYLVDYNELPPADREAGPFMSHMPSYVQTGNGPAGGGSWDGLPWLLVEKNYVSDWQIMFCPKYLKQYKGTTTLRGDYPRYHNFRYAYNSSAVSSGVTLGGAGNVMSGTVWIVRDLWIAPQSGWYGDSYPDYPADYLYPWGEGEWRNKAEQVIYSDMAVKLVVGGTDRGLSSN